MNIQLKMWVDGAKIVVSNAIHNFRNYVRSASIIEQTRDHLHDSKDSWGPSYEEMFMREWRKNTESKRSAEYIKMANESIDMDKFLLHMYSSSDPYPTPTILKERGESHD